MNALLLRRTLTYRLRRLGMPGKLGMALIAVCLVYLFAVLLPARTRSHQIELRIAEASVKLQRAEQSSANGATTPAEKLMAFYRDFPRGTTIPDWLSKIYAIADQQKLDLEIGEYSLTHAKSGRLDQFRIVFPVKGSYPQIRKFIGAALTTAPALALDSLNLKREKIGDEVVDGRVVFLLYLERDQ